ncbi:hypothetical protein IE53DRAFT_386172 [Violaceomyces palustris]|uniref:Uncharacterized protein n=1 Tax=Violaceomyces palustris TaxID=1673888 RepID=A0ACD0P083_9BASI|nr:hypothetical protein IE53DRAFT_386172 [Violaceomyces palustris]
MDYGVSRGEVLEKVVEYLIYNTKYSQTSNDADIPDFQNRIPPEIALELLMAADFLDGKCERESVSSNFHSPFLPLPEWQDTNQSSGEMATELN